MSTADYKFSDRFSGHGILHTPEGVRDVYNGECARKLAVQERMHKVLHSHGFHDIQTPMFEFFDIFNKERGTVASKNMYKFFDREGNTLVLRPDITPSIARCAAKYYKEEEFPIRLCYIGNTFINNSSYQGKLKEATQLGAELMNDDTSDADAEMIALTIECLQQSGVKEFQVEVGHAEFFLGLVEEANFAEEEINELKSLMMSKNLFGVEMLISEKEMPVDLKELFMKLPALFGTAENLEYAKTKTKNKRALRAIDRLEKLHAILETYGLSDYVTFDLGMLSKYNYYTGIIFRAFTYGNGEPIVKGGRYNNLVEQFGKKAPAIGVAIEVDQLMAALSRQKIEEVEEEKDVLVLYPSAERKSAISFANELRKEGKKVALIRKSSKKSLEEYEAYGDRSDFGTIYFVEKGNKISKLDSVKSI